MSDIFTDAIAVLQAMQRSRPLIDLSYLTDMELVLMQHVLRQYPEDRDSLYAVQCEIERREGR